MGVLLILGAITLYRTYALYEEKKEFNVLKGKVPSFINGDVNLAMTLDGNSITEVPSRGAYDVNVVCDDKQVKAYWDYEKWGVLITNISRVRVGCVIEFKTGNYLNDLIMALSDTSNEVEKISHEATEQTPALIDYRYTGKNPNNYVYFGCNDVCTEDDLYRIIGVIPTQSSDTGSYENRVKLIKMTNYEGPTALTGATSTSSGKSYFWNDNEENNWENSTLKDILNKEYWQSLGEYQNYIGQSKWYLGAPDYSKKNIYSGSNFYQEERSTTSSISKGNISYINNIGLIYPSDYAYSLKNVTNESLYEEIENYKTNAWLHILGEEYSEWTITPEHSRTEHISAWFNSGNSGILATHTLFRGEGMGVRPTFYLKKEVLYESGEGTRENPYRIKLL